MTNHQAENKPANEVPEVKPAKAQTAELSENNVRLATGLRAGINPFTKQPMTW